MKKLGAILFVIVLILGLPFVAGAEQQVEQLNITGVDFSVDSWNPEPSWGPNGDDGIIARYRGGDNIGDNIITVNFEEPKAGLYTAINVKLRVSSAFNTNDNVLAVRIFAGENRDEINGGWYLPLQENQDPNHFTDYIYPLTGLDMTADDLTSFQVEIEVTEFYDGWLQFSAIQVELTSESTEPPPPLQVDFTSTPTSGEEPLTVEFEADYLGGERTSYEWDFDVDGVGGDDGNMSTDSRQSVVSHTYKAGTYTVSLTVTDGTASGTVTKENLITVTPAYVPVLEARTKSFHSHRYGERVCVRLRVKNISDHMVHKFKVAMYSSDNPNASIGDLGEPLKERTFHKSKHFHKRKRCLLKPNRGRNVWLRYNSATDESLSGKYLILVVKAVMDDQVEGYTASAEVVDDMVKILVP